VLTNLDKGRMIHPSSRVEIYVQFTKWYICTALCQDAGYIVSGFFASKPLLIICKGCLAGYVISAGQIKAPPF
jgi:hypothetical protein